MTQVGKAKLDHPALSTAGGAPLHAAIETIYENISNHLPARWQLFESVAAGGSVTFEHGFQVPLADLRVHVYIKGASSNTKVADLGAAGWSVVATSGFAQTKLNVTAPSSGGPFDFYLYVSHEPMDDKISISGGTMTGSLVLTSDPTYPSQDLHAATKGYVDAVAQGLSPKQVVKAATTANIGLSGTMTIDGVAVDAGDRVLVKDQTTASQNGIYVVGAGAWSRASDMDAWTEVPGSFCFVEKGTANADKGYVCTADSGGTVGSTAITWVRFTGVEALEVDGVTLDKASGTLKVKDGGIGTTQLSGSIPDSKLATIATAGKVNTSAITGTLGIGNGGTGQTTQQAALNALAGTQSSGKYLRSDGTNTSLSTLQAADVPTLNQNTTGTAANVTGTVAIANGGTGQTTANAALNALLPSQTSKANKYLKSDGSNTSWAAAQGGSGEVNVVADSTGADGVGAWLAGTNHGITATTGANSPLHPSVTNYFQIVANANVAIPPAQNNASGVYYPWTCPSALQNRKLKVEFFYSSAASSYGTWALVVYKGSTRVPLSTDSAGDTIIPANSTGKFVAYFDTDGSSSYTLNFVQRTFTSQAALNITNVIIGPGVQPQGAVVGEWQSFTPVTFGATTYSSLTGRYRRVGDSAQIRISATINSASGTYWFDMPTSIGTIDATKVRNGNYQDQYGVATYYNSPSVNYAGIVQKTNVANRIRIVGPNGGNEWSQSTNVPTTPAAGHGIELEFTVPIAEWAGSGTVQLAQNDVEYAYNISTSGTGDSASFGYGPAGFAIPSITPSAGTSTTQTYRVRFQTPIQQSDKLTLEFQEPSTGRWFDGAVDFPYMHIKLTVYGVRLRDVNTTDVDVQFGAGGYSAFNATNYGDSGSAWSGLSTWKWRVRKSSAGAAVGFGIVAPGVSSGLVSASGLPGNTTGNAIASGYVGERVTMATQPSNVNTTTTITDWTNATITLNKGIWLIMVNADGQISASDFNFTFSAWVKLCNAAGSVVDSCEPFLSIKVTAAATGTTGGSLVTSTVQTVTSDSTAYKLRVLNSSGCTAVFSGPTLKFYAVRIA